MASPSTSDDSPSSPSLDSPASPWYPPQVPPKDAAKAAFLAKKKKEHKKREAARRRALDVAMQRLRALLNTPRGATQVHVLERAVTLWEQQHDDIVGLQAELAMAQAELRCLHVGLPAGEPPRQALIPALVAVEAVQLAEGEGALVPMALGMGEVLEGFPPVGLMEIEWAPVPEVGVAVGHAIRRSLTGEGTAPGAELYDD